MSVKELYPSKSGFLKASDLQGRTVKVKISETGVSHFDGGAKLNLTFLNKEKKLTLNKTNASILADALGDDEKLWVGKEIELSPAKTTFQGALVDTIRVQVSSPVEDVDGAIPF